jgi:hypothetical protein
MNCKRLAGIAVLLTLLTLPVSASMVSILIVETGLDEEIASPQYSSLWEGGLMASFFDSGHIVTNGPITRIGKNPPRDLSGTIKEDFNEAALVGAEYFVLGFLEYQIRGMEAVPLEITIKLFKIDSQELVCEQNFPAGKGNNFREEYQFAQNAGRTIISQIKDR